MLLSASNGKPHAIDFGSSASSGMYTAPARPAAAAAAAGAGGGATSSTTGPKARAKAIARAHTSSTSAAKAKAAVVGAAKTDGASKGHASSYPAAKGAAPSPSKALSAGSHATLASKAGAAITEAVMDSLRERSRDTVIIFDWDDTLLSSSWLASHGLRLDTPGPLPAHVQAHMVELQASVISLLESAAVCGRVVIVTNAETGWVELSAQKFMPGVLPLLSKTRVVSARSTFEPVYPDSPSDWKVQAFWEEVRSTVDEKGVGRPLHALSLGDSIHERQAIHTVTEGLAHARTKSVKFVERPNAEQLKRQVDFVHSCIHELVLHEDNFDLMLTISMDS